MRERQQLDTGIKTITDIETELSDHIELISMGEEESDEEIVTEAEKALTKLHSEMGRRQVDTLLSGEVDANDSFIEIHAGAGGTESQDWASMLLRMYIRWAEKNDYTVELQSQTDGDEAGIKAATILIKGTNAHGWLKTESGVHRLVRISPFDSQSRRHTSFSSVWVYPVIDDNVDIDIQEKISASIPIVHRVPEVSTLTLPIPPCASPMLQPASWSPVRKNPSIKTAPTR
jgi:peptide chain release factor 2